MDQSEGRVRINMQHIAIQEVKVGRQAPQEVQSLAGVVDSSQLDSPELEELERIKLLQRKTEHGLPSIKRGCGTWSTYISCCSHFLSR